MTKSLSDVLAGQRWEKALFTTYSLSLTFFESIVLRALREVECREIWVVADAEGYRSSLMERGSHGVGYEYHLVPVGLRNGVFHPKCCYLAGPDGDLLVVGSGNLTFGGFGRNLEDDSVVFAIGIGVGGDVASLLEGDFVEVVLADVEFDAQVVQIGQ